MPSWHGSASVYKTKKHADILMIVSASCSSLPQLDFQGLGGCSRSSKTPISAHSVYGRQTLSLLFRVTVGQIVRLNETYEKNRINE